MKNRRRYPEWLILVAAILLIAACSSAPMKVYEGPQLPESQTALVASGPHTYIASCDGVRLDASRLSVAVLPGRHTVEVAFAGIETETALYYSRALGSITFTVEAGRAYQAYARPDYSSDTWMVLVTDVASRAVVGRSDPIPMAVHPLQKGFISS
jgi:hypothetical protein